MCADMCRRMTVAMHRMVASLGALPMVVLTEYQDEVELFLLRLVIFFPRLALRLAAAAAAVVPPAPPPNPPERRGDEGEARGEEACRNFAISASSNSNNC